MFSVIRVPGWRADGDVQKRIAVADEESCFAACQRAPWCRLASYDGYSVSQEGTLAVALRNSCAMFARNSETHFIEGHDRPGHGSSLLTLAAVEAVSSMGVQVDYHGGEIKYRGLENVVPVAEGNVPNSELCRLLCVAHPRCNAATWIASLRQCYLKAKTVLNPTPNNDCISYRLEHHDRL